jgi:hypothetical protein
MNPLAIFAILLLVVGILLLLHHGYKHMSDSETSLPHTESCAAVCFFQRSNIRNHETWILICFTNAFSLGVLVPLFYVNRELS